MSIIRIVQGDFFICQTVSFNHKIQTFSTNFFFVSLFIMAVHIGNTVIGMKHV